MDKNHLLKLFDDVVNAWCNYESGISSFEDFKAAKEDAVQDIQSKMEVKHG